MRKIFNASNVLGAIAFILMIAIVGFVAGENFLMAWVSLVLFAIGVYLAMKEDGQIK